MDNLAENMMFRLVFQVKLGCQVVDGTTRAVGRHVMFTICCFFYIAIVGFSCIGNGWSDFPQNVTTASTQQSGEQQTGEISILVELFPPFGTCLLACALTSPKFETRGGTRAKQLPSYQAITTTPSARIS